MSTNEEMEDQEKHNKCMGRMEEALNKNTIVNKLLDSISSLGCEIPKDFFSCIKCDQKDISGGFVQPAKDNLNVYKPKLLMNESVDISKKVFETTIIHELIHAYDICRVKSDSQNCQHNACMEIRASALRSVI
jgi:inner membrane protease ATP23